MLVTALRERIKERNPFDILTYNSVVESSMSVNDEQYYDCYNHESYFFMHSVDGSLIIGLLDNEDDQLTAEISLPRKDGSHLLTIDYRGVIQSNSGSFDYEEITYSTKILKEEEEYFMESTVENLPLSMNENMMIMSFIKKAYELIDIRKYK